MAYQSRELWVGIGQALGPAVVAVSAYMGAQVVAWVTRKKVPPHKPHQPVEVNSRLDIEITLRLEELRHQTGGMRCFLSRFHNGDRYMDESDIVRKSRTHEVVRPGVSYEAERVRHVLISTIPEEMALVIEDGPSYTRISTIKQGKFRWICEQTGVRSTARCAIRRGRDITGFIGVDWDTDTEAPPCNILLVCETAFALGQLLHAAVPPSPV